MKNFKLIIEYDGTGFNGWQIQKTGRTIQGELEKAVAVMTRRQIRITGSGRTDAGVHALGQVANFRCDTRLDSEAFFSGLNSLLPPDIVITACTQVDDTFHARYDAKQKTYHYRILNRPLPAAVGRHYAWYIKPPLDVAAMQQAADHLLGTHDFSSFENTGSPRSDSVRTLYQARFVQSPGKENLTFEITANGFLRYMVRNIVGTLVAVGQSKLRPAEFSTILASRDRNQAGTTAPPHGLFLICVDYQQRV